MDIMQAVILGIVQGATEFIPISSSGHLVLVPWVFGWPNPGLAFDTVLHLGTLSAVLFVFWRDLAALAVAWFDSIGRLRLVVRTEVRTSDSKALTAKSHEQPAERVRPEAARVRVAWWVVLATIPAVLMGMLWEEQFEALLHSPAHVSVLLVVTGLWLALAEHFGRKEHQAEDLTWWQSLLVGVAQGCAIAPGISRSGATIGAGLLLGLRRDAATRFSFLLSAPIILGAGALQVRRLLATPNLDASLPSLLTGFLAAAVSGYACIRLLLTYVRERSLIVFSAYCWLVALAALAIYWLR